FMEVRIPKNALGNLDQAAVRWDDRVTIRGKSATRPFQGGEILLLQDLQEPTQKSLSEMLAADEVARWVPVDANSFIPEKVNPGDLVSFLVPKLPDANIGAANSIEPAGLAQTEIIGPFRILMLGTRTGRKGVQEAAGGRSGPEHIITIRVQLDENGQMEQKAQDLFESLRLTGNKSVQVVLHSAKMKEE
ncbi:MAG: hypothetical protein ACREJB_00135, partial [Planctomycetaceae bacterium]